MKIVTKARALLIAAFAATGVLAGTAPAQAAPVHQADHVSCFAHAVPPAKTATGSMAPIAFGYILHCDPHPPALIALRVKLWRLDFNRAETFEHASHTVFSPTYDREVWFYASCSNASIRYAFHTEVILDGINGNPGEYSDNSSAEQMTC